MAKKQRDGVKERLWRQRLSRWERSGLSIREFCRHEQLSEPSFYGWRRELNRRAGLRAKSPRGRAPAAPDFVPVGMLPEAWLASRASGHSTDFVLELAGGRRLRLPGSLPLAQLAALVQAIEANSSARPVECSS